MTALAVVIPAYKPDFLAAALQSLAAQSVEGFEVLVADDCSPHAAEISDITRRFESDLRITYHRFAENLGGRSLTAQWSRSVRLTKSPWVWLFSDDDVADANCVEVLLEAIARPSARATRVFHFNTRIIDDGGKLIRATMPFPPRLAPEQFVQGRMDLHYSSFACEYAFSRAAFDAAGGFVDFPAAWCADDASWLAFADGTDIATLDGAMLSWRRSEKNVSSPDSGRGREKVEAMIAYAEWLASRGISVRRDSGVRWFRAVLAEQGLRLGPRRILRAANAFSQCEGSATLPCAIALLHSELTQTTRRLKGGLTRRGSL